MSDYTSTSDLTLPMTTFYNRVLLTVAEPKLIHLLFAESEPIPQGTGDTIKFQRFTAPTAATTPVSEGVTPPGEKLASSFLTAKVSQYGGWVGVTDVLTLESPDKVLTRASERNARQMALTLDTIARDILAACASASNCTSGSNTLTPTEFNATDLALAVRTLLGNDAEMFQPIIKASTGVGTTPIREAYWGLAHTDMDYDIGKCTNFVPVAKYPNQGGVLPAERGSIDDVRFLVSSNGYKGTTSGYSSYKIFIIAKNAYGYSKLDGSSVGSIYHDFKTAGGPLEQQATMAWKVMFVARILNDNNMYVLNATTSDKKTT